MTLETLFWTIFWITADTTLLVGCGVRLVRLAIMDDLGRRALIPAEVWVRDRLPEHRQWVADGFTCPYCIGFWIGCLIVGSYWLSLASPEWVLVSWRLIAGTLALNYVVGHLVASLDIYDGDDENQEDAGADKDEESR